MAPKNRAVRKQIDPLMIKTEFVNRYRPPSDSTISPTKPQTVYNETIENKTNEVNLRVFVTTWNLGNSNFQGGGDWLGKAHDCHVIAIGIQEGKVKDCLQKFNEIFGGSNKFF